MSQVEWPDWFHKLHSNLRLCNAVTLHGNVKDYLLYPTGDSATHLPIQKFLDRFLRDLGFKLVGHYDFVDGLEFLQQEQLDLYESLKQEVDNESLCNDYGGQAYSVPGEQDITGEGSDNSSANDKFLNQAYSAQSIPFHETFSRIRQIYSLKSCPSIATIIYFFDYIIGSAQQMDLAERQDMTLLEKIILSSRRIGELPQLIVVIADDLSKVPSFLYSGSAKSSQVYIPSPSKHERYWLIAALKSLFYLETGDSGDPLIHIENLAAYTEGLTNYDLNNLTIVSKWSQIPLNDAKTLVKRYKFGQSKSPWDELSRERIFSSPWKRVCQDKQDHAHSFSSGDQTYETVQLSLKDCLKERVVGQDQAVEAIEAMVIRAVQGIQSSKSEDLFAKPKGTFLFCGPTGVGKTELTKAFAEWMFGDEQAMLRFDMSEFNQEHSDQKLMGSPPGYVGHEQGGQLTNSIKKRPFCVILFDEVDKMHRKIWDIFLQILEDGRLTDGLGDTVYFSETVIIMTSNIGGASQPKDQKDKNKIRQHYIRSVRDFFRNDLGRPEILNRLGMDNVIAFNPIEESFQEEIIKRKLNTLRAQYHEKESIKLSFSPDVIEYLKSNPEGFANNGARGVENLITTHIINPLAKYLFYNSLEVKDKYPSLEVQLHKDEYGVCTSFKKQE